MKWNSVLLVAVLGLAMALTGCIGSGGYRIFTSQYGSVRDEGYQVPSIPIYKVPRQYHRQIVSYETKEKPGTIIVDTNNKFLYFVLGDGKAMRYGAGVGRGGLAWAGTNPIPRKAKWPGWTPPPQMIRREAAKGRDLPAYMEGGPNNPLGARALYIGSTLYRIHGTPEWYSIGKAVSSGCIRLMNQDIIDLYDRAEVGAKVIVM